MVGTLVSPIEGLKLIDETGRIMNTIVGTLVSPIEGLKRGNSAGQAALFAAVGTLVSPIEGLKHLQASHRKEK